MNLPFLFLKNLLKDRRKMMPATPVTVQPDNHLNLSVKMIPGLNINKHFISLVIHNSSHIIKEAGTLTSEQVIDLFQSLKPILIEVFQVKQKCLYCNSNSAKTTQHVYFPQINMVAINLLL